MKQVAEYKKNLFNLINEVIGKNCPDAVMLSGGIDSSSISYIAHEFNKNLVCVTVNTNNTESPDLQFAKIVSKDLKIDRHIVAMLDEDELDQKIKTIVLTLENFNIYWVSAALVLFKGLEVAKKNGLKKIATGEGADDLFGSFPVMLSWKDGDDSLKIFIETRMKDIDIMTKRIADYLELEVVMPFHDKKIVELALGMPMEFRTKENNDGTKITKYILRETFSEFLPESIVSRPQTMAFTGASTLDVLLDKYKNYADIAIYKTKYKLNFSSSFECYLFDILNNAGRYNPIAKGSKCLYCGSKLRAENSVHCTVCGTLQYAGEVLSF